jgi:hypothetical protein
LRIRYTLKNPANLTSKFNVRSNDCSSLEARPFAACVLPFRGRTNFFNCRLANDIRSANGCFCHVFSDQLPGFRTFLLPNTVKNDDEPTGSEIAKWSYLRIAVLRQQLSNGNGAILMRLEENMLAAIAGILFVLWLLGFLAFHVTSGVIHILLVLALISLVMHFVRGKRVTV